MADSKRDPFGIRVVPGDAAPTAAPVVGRARARLDVPTYVAGVLSRNRAILARTISLVESTRASDRELAGRVLAELLPHTGGSHRVGITGVPGVGKSTFIEALGTHLTARGETVAVLAVDPSSQLSGGSILGDKTRMNRLSIDPNAFVRPSPTGGTLGGVAGRTRESVLVCEAAGFDVVLVETVGVGQSETAVAGMVDFFLALMLPGAGDELQGIKRGLVELVDMIAINKADGEFHVAAGTAARQYASALRTMRRRSADWTPPVVTCSAITGTGVAELWEIVEERLAAMRASGALLARRREQSESWFEALVDEGLRHAFESNPHVAAVRHEVTHAVRQGILTPVAAAERLLLIWRRAMNEETP